jgi:hypothetical protein
MTQILLNKLFLQEKITELVSVKMGRKIIFARLLKAVLGTLVILPLFP